jgi:HSP20 family protein
LKPEPYVSKRLIIQIPSVNIAETDSELYIELAAPGLQKENFKIAVEMEQLTIIGERNKNQ